MRQDPVHFITFESLLLIVLGYILCRSQYYRAGLFVLPLLSYFGFFGLALYLRLTMPDYALERAYWLLFRSIFVGSIFGPVFLPTRHALLLGIGIVITLILWTLIFQDTRPSQLVGWNYLETMSTAIAENILVILGVAFWHFLHNLRNKQLQQAVQEAQALQLKAEEASKVKSEFLALTSHELRTPLNSIIGYTDCVLLGVGVEGPQLSTDQRTLLERIRNKSQHLLTNVNDILDMSKLEAQQIQVVLMPFSVRTLVNTVISQLSSLASSKGISLSAAISPEIQETLLGDEYLISRILNNLVANAIKFTPSGQVDIKVQTAGSEYWCLRVTDTGIGIAEELHQLIFEPFRQADSSITRVYGGTGLGLAIVRDYTKLLSGTVQVESAPNSGSIFTVILPLVTFDTSKDHQVRAI